MANNKELASPLIDPYGRQVTYLRMSVTDRCDLRCTYCMAPSMKFLPKADLLTLEELETVGRAFIARGVRKIRITGGEPLVRKDIGSLFSSLGKSLGNGLDELTLTTNATLLDRFAPLLREAGVRRINVSLDSIDADRFREITRRGDLSTVMRGLDAADNAGLKIKINTVALKHQNADHLPEMISWAHARGYDMTLIEVMPLGLTGEDRFDQYIPLSAVREGLEQQWTLTDDISRDVNGGPSRYVKISETGGKLGLITPLTNNFCAGCNRVRITCTGRIYMCLGQDDHVDLRATLRGDENSMTKLHRQLDLALGAKPEKHNFAIKNHGEAPSIARHMSVTGG